MENLTYRQIISELSYHQMLSILESLGEDVSIRKRITELASGLLAQLNEDELADLLFERLNAINVVDLWESSGKGYYGYNDPVDVANDMLNDEVQPFRDEMLKYRRLGLKEQEEICFRAIVRGLLRYDKEGDNEFRDWVPDDPLDTVDNEFYEWHQEHPEVEMEKLKKMLG